MPNQGANVAPIPRAEGVDTNNSRVTNKNNPGGNRDYAVCLIKRCIVQVNMLRFHKLQVKLKIIGYFYLLCLNLHIQLISARKTNKSENLKNIKINCPNTFV